MVKNPVGQIHHLIRYFFIFGILAFVAFIKKWNDDLSLIPMGPPLYLTENAEKLISPSLGLPRTQNFIYFAFLLPLTIVYFSLLGFQIKQLWNERGPIKYISLAALLGFIFYIHFAAWKNLSGYFVLPF